MLIARARAKERCITSFLELRRAFLVVWTATSAVQRVWKAFNVAVPARNVRPVNGVGRSLDVPLVLLPFSFLQHWRCIHDGSRCIACLLRGANRRFVAAVRPGRPVCCTRSRCSLPRGGAYRTRRYHLQMLVMATQQQQHSKQARSRTHDPPPPLLAQRTRSMIAAC